MGGSGGLFLKIVLFPVFPLFFPKLRQPIDPKWHQHDPSLFALGGDVKLEVDDVTVLNDIRFAFEPVFAGRLDLGHPLLPRVERFEVVVPDNVSPV